MKWTHFLLGFVRQYETWVLIALSAIVLILVVINLSLALKVGKLSRGRRRAATTEGGTSAADIEDILNRLDGSDEQHVLLGEKLKVTDERLAQSIQKVGLVRFDAFPDVGGEQSFALALLDREMNGVVLSSLYSRSESRVYAKEVSGGQSQHALSDEEREALRRAGVK